MRLIVVSGFLGSGKTTFIIQMAKAILRKKAKVVILVNEIGEIGVDDQFMSKLGLNVREILGGCICCTLAGNLKATLKTVIQEHNPQWIILEPSGVADPEAVDGMINALDNRHAVQLCKVTLVDPLRMEMMMTVLTPLITSQIRSAEWIIINKTDTATRDEMDFAGKTIRTINPGAQTACISAKTGLPDSLAEGLLI